MTDYSVEAEGIMMDGADPDHASRLGRRIDVTLAERDKRIAVVEAELSDVLRAVLHHFGPEGAHKVTTTALALIAARKTETAKQ